MPKAGSAGITKAMTCGHSQAFHTPVPREGGWVWCRTCDTSVRLLRKKTTVAEGRTRRLKENARANNQYTSGRQLSTA